MWQSIIVRWDPLPEEFTNGIITGYRIRYRQNKDRRQTIVAVDGTQAQCTLSRKYSNTALLKIYYWWNWMEFNHQLLLSLMCDMIKLELFFLPRVLLICWFDIEKAIRPVITRYSSNSLWRFLSESFEDQVITTLSTGTETPQNIETFSHH